MLGFCHRLHCICDCGLEGIFSGISIGSWNNWILRQKKITGKKFKLQRKHRQFLPESGHNVLVLVAPSLKRTIGVSSFCKFTDVVGMPLTVTQEDCVIFGVRRVGVHQWRIQDFHRGAPTLGAGGAGIKFNFFLRKLHEISKTSHRRNNWRICQPHLVTKDPISREYWPFQNWLNFLRAMTNDSSGCLCYDHKDGFSWNSQEIKLKVHVIRGSTSKRKVRVKPFVVAT